MFYGPFFACSSSPGEAGTSRFSVQPYPVVDLSPRSARCWFRTGFRPLWYDTQYVVGLAPTGHVATLGNRNEPTNPAQCSLFFAARRSDPISPNCTQDDGIKMLDNISIMSSVESILKANNDAVSSLCNGDHSTTISTLRIAIKSLEKCFEESECASYSEQPPRKRRRRDASTRSMPPTITDAATSKDDYVPVRSVSVSECRSATRSAEPVTFMSNTDLLVIFDRAFDFPTVKADDFLFTTHQSKTRLAAILLWNLGLAYHREGARKGTYSDLQAALRFYREAYLVLKSAWSKTDFEEVFVLLLGLLNNMACIHSSLSDVKDTHQCINWMNKAIASRQRSILTKEDFTFFSLNLSVFRGHQLRYAAAA
jgi:hypothetical protein